MHESAINRHFPASKGHTFLIGAQSIFVSGRALQRVAVRPTAQDNAVHEDTLGTSGCNAEQEEGEEDTEKLEVSFLTG